MVNIMKKITKLLITILLFLTTIVLFKKNSTFRNWFNENIMNKTLSFTAISKAYESLFGSPIPFKKIESVFNEKLVYRDKEDYNNGVILTVDNNLIPSLSNGLVIFVGEKDYKNCVVVEDESLEITYCLLSTFGVKLYDHVSKGSYIGEVNDKVLLYFKKNGEYLNYEDFL